MQKDFFGQEIKVGDWVGYGRRNGDSSITTVYHITDVKPGKVQGMSFRASSDGSDFYLYSSVKSTLRETNRTFKLPESMIPKKLKDMV